jgi:hypothetical protein
VTDSGEPSGGNFEGSWSVMLPMLMCQTWVSPTVACLSGCGQRCWFDCVNDLGGPGGGNEICESSAIIPSDNG